MASLALGVAGAAIGSFFGPLGTSIGWAIGAGLGGALFAKGQQGPRLTDLRVQTSAYGTPIPIGFGTIKLAGSTIWATDLVESTHKSSGKGGPKVTTYSYSASFAIALLQTSYIDGSGALINNPIVGILRIWADGRLIYGPGSPAATLPMTIYYGDEEQLPDPTIEADKGAGNVSAHRGLAYVVFTDLQLGDYGNRIPNLAFEIQTTGTIELQRYADWKVSYSDEVSGSMFSFPSRLSGVETIDIDGVTHIRLHQYRAAGDYGFPSSPDLEYVASTWTMEGQQVGGFDSDSYTPIPGLPHFVSSNYWHMIGSLNSGVAYAWGQIIIDCSDPRYGEKAADTLLDTFVWLYNGNASYVASFDYCVAAQCSSPSSCVVGDQLNIKTPPVYFSGNVFATGSTPIVNSSLSLTGNTGAWLHRWPAPRGAPEQAGSDRQMSLTPYTWGDGSDCSLAVGDDGYLYCMVRYTGDSFPDPPDIGGFGTRLLKLDKDLNLVQLWSQDAKIPFNNDSKTDGGFTIHRGNVIFYQYTSSTPNDVGAPSWGEPRAAMYKLNTDDTVTYVASVETAAAFGGGSGQEAFLTSIISLQNGYAAYRGGVLNLGSDGTVLLKDIVADVSSRMGYASDQYDVTALTDVVRGYTISSRMSGRSAIEALQPAYQFGAVESNLQVKFVKWGGEIAATIPDADLGARQADTDPVDPIATTRAQESDLPRVVNTVYFNLNMDYQEGTQIAQRQVTSSELSVAVSLPIVLIDAEAKQMTDVILFNAWMERDKFSFPLPRKWAHLEPTDVVDIGGHTVRITGKNEAGYTYVQFDGLATRSGVFVGQSTTPKPGGFVPQPVPSLVDTDIVLADLPLISDTDFTNGFYAAIAPVGPGGWTGATLFKSSDGGVNYTDIASTVSSDTFGYPMTILGNFSGGNVFDEINTVQVILSAGSGELSSSNTLGVLNGANVAAIGPEIIQFRTATLVAADTYVLSGLLRGRRGTEWAMDTHVLQDVFILMPTHNIEGAFAEIWQARQYKAVTTGGMLANAPAHEFINKAVALRCYAPVQLGGGRDASDNLTLNWIRRTRIGGAWSDYVDVPLSEPTEKYAVYIYDDDTYALAVRAFVPTVQTQAYTAAEQTTDFGSPQSTVYWGVSQVGNYGTGYEARGAT